MKKIKSVLMCVLSMLMIFSTLPMPVHATMNDDVTLERNLIPKPLKFYQKEGSFTLTSETKISLEVVDISRVGEIKNNIVNPLHNQIKNATGYDLVVLQNQDVNQNVIKIKLEDNPTLKEEGYQLNVTTQFVELIANKPAGLFRGLQTLRQLFPAEIEKQTVSTNVSWELPNCDITDVPRFDYRSTMLDICRHFFDKDEIKREIDLASQYKINKFHIHLSDDQGWRLEMKGSVNGESLSKLTTIGASTSVSLNGYKPGYLTQEDFVEIVNYAQAHYIEVIPEFDMPGHTWAALVSMESLNSTPDKKPVSDKFDNTKPTDTIDVGFSTFECNNENTYSFIEEIIRQVSAISPSKYIHIGGDESHTTSREDYAKFFERVLEITKKNNKIAIGWQEFGNVLSEENKQHSIAQYWLIDGKPFTEGVNYVLSPANRAYLDMKYDASSEYGLNWAGYTSVKKSYEWEPTEYGSESQIVGVEAPLWTETVANLDALDYLVYPRLISVAEIGWSSKDGRYWDEYKARLKSYGKRLAYQGVKYYQDEEVWHQTDEDKVQQYEESLVGGTDISAPIKRGATPNQSQMDYYKDELAAFIHFGPNTFTGKEWGNGTADELKAFDPTELNTDQWVQALKDAGFKKVIVTAKHHDGFQLWPSQYSEKNVKTSGFANRVGKDKVDVLEMLSASCTKIGMDMGLYLSPWDMSEPSYGQPVKVLNDKNEVVLELDEEGNIKEGTDKTRVGDVFYGKIVPVKGEQDKNGDYNEFYLNQLKEVLENPKYGRDGRFKEIWMDGAKNDVRYQEYDLEEWWNLCRRLEPNVLIFNNIGNDIRWVGNENGHSYDPIWAQVSKDKLWNDYQLGCNSKPDSNTPSKIRIVNSTDHRTGKTFKTWNYAESYEDGNYLKKGDPNGDLWSMPESDSSIIGGWFWSQRNPQSGKELVEKYFQSVGNATPMLLNTPPNRKGLLELSYIESLREFRSILDNTFKTNVAKGAVAIASSTYKNSPTYKASNVTNGNYDSYWAADEGTSGQQQITVFLDGVQQFDLIDIKEYVPLGQNVSDYDVEVRVNGKWNTFGKTGSTKKNKKTIGYRSILRDNTVNADAIRLTIKQSYGSVKINEIGAYKMDERIEFSKGATSIPKEIENNFVSAHSAQRTGHWNLNDQDTVRENSMTTNDSNATVTYKFTGSRFFISSRYSFNFGAMMVSVDNKPEFEVNLNDPVCTISSIVYYSDTLPQGEHTVRIRPTTKNGKNWIATDGLFYLNNDEKGMFEIEKTNLNVVESENVKLVVRRIGGNKGEASVRVSTKPGSAVHGKHYIDVNEVVTFKNGEDQKIVELPTLDNAEYTGILNYTVELSNAANAILGFNRTATINIIDNEVNTAVLEKQIETASSLNQADYEDDVWNQLQKFINEAKTFIKRDGINQKDVDDYCITFDNQMKTIRKKGTYTVISLDHVTSIEAEDCEISGGATVYKKEQEPNAWKNLSGTGMVGDINEKGNITMWLYFPKAGQYELNVQYYAGAENQIHFSDKFGNSKIEKTLHVSPGYPTNVKTTIDVLDSGVYGFNFIKNKNISKDHANLDKFTFAFVKEIVNKNSLKQAIDDVPAKSSNYYTEATWEAYMQALTKAKEIDADINATQDEVNNAKTALEEAKVALVVKDVVPLLYSATLKDKVSLNIFLELNEKVLTDESAYVELSVAGSKETIKHMLSTLEVSEGNLYKVSLPLYVRQMNDVVTMHVHTATADDTYTYSIVQYGKDVLASKKSSNEAKALVEAMLNYGAMAQVYFDYNTNHLANATVTNKAYEQVSAEQLENYNTVVSGKVDGMVFGGTNLRLLSETAIRHHFVVSAEIENLYKAGTIQFVLVNGEEETVLTPTFYGGNKAYVEVTNIYAKNLDHAYTVKVVNAKTQETFTVTSSAFSYAKDALTKSSNNQLKDVVKAMVDYNTKAKAYQTTMQ